MPSDSPELRGAGTAWPYRHVVLFTFLCSLGFFVLGFTGGYLALSLKLLPPTTRITDRATYEAEIKSRASLPPAELVRKIIPNNLAVVAAFLGGIVTLGAQAAIHLGWFGFGLGLSLAEAKLIGVPVSFPLAYLLPHGLIELAGFFLAGSLGFRALMYLIRYLRGGPALKKGELRSSLVVAAVSLGLVLIAGAVECFLTASIARWWAG